MHLTSEENTERRSTYSGALQRKKEQPKLSTVWFLFLRNKNKLLESEAGEIQELFFRKK